MRTLDSALGLRRVGADDVDVQLRQSTPKLRHATILANVRVGDTKDARLVTVEGHGLAVALAIGSSRFEVIES